MAQMSNVGADGVAYKEDKTCILYHVMLPVAIRI